MNNIVVGTIYISKSAIPYRPSYFSLLHVMFYPQQHIFLLLEDFLSLVEPYIHMEPIRVVVIKIMIFFIEINLTTKIFVKMIS